MHEKQAVFKSTIALFCGQILLIIYKNAVSFRVLRPRPPPWALPMNPTGGQSHQTPVNALAIGPPLPQLAPRSVTKFASIYI